MLLALFLLAAQPAPPVRMVVPESIKRERGAAPGQIELFSDPALAEALGTFDPRPGAWAEYAVLPAKGSRTRLRVAVLSPLLPGGRYWLETASQAENGPPVSVKMLLHGPPGRVENMERIYVYIGGQAPLELPLPDLRGELEPRPAGTHPPIRRGGPQTVRVPAGEFAADLLRVAATRIWRSAKVPLWGLVRAQAPGKKVELIGYGLEGAETVFPPGFDEPAPPQGNGKESVK